ncbi:Hypothetical predicted protein [Paramuricea clavata]|uniref:Uncharacterized protein n=1 Tax=Paramuricea clavata TaxID=317549 RepID=A0A7D9HZ83_PARCT|nr:Hypothetical predicted protein [Paramuricea clavata]
MDEVIISPVVAISMDETSDIKTLSQLTTIIRYVDADGKPVERFLGFSDVSEDRTAARLKQEIDSILEERTHLLDTIVGRRIPTGTAVRWHYHARLMHAILETREKLVEVFEYILEHDEEFEGSVLNDTRGYRNILTDFQFVFCLNIFSAVFGLTTVLYDIVQSKQFDIAYCVTYLLEYSVASIVIEMQELRLCWTGDLEKLKLLAEFQLLKNQHTIQYSPKAVEYSNLDNQNASGLQKRHEENNNIIGSNLNDDIVMSRNDALQSLSNLRSECLSNVCYDTQLKRLERELHDEQDKTKQLESELTVAETKILQLEQALNLHELEKKKLPPNPRIPPKQVDKQEPQKHAGQVSQFPKYTEISDKNSNDNEKRHKPSQHELTNCYAIPTRVTHRTPSKKSAWRQNKHDARINQTEEGFRKDKWKANMRFFQYYY